MARSRAAAAAREIAARVGVHPLSGLWTDAAELAARVESGEATPLDLARADAADVLRLAHAIARLADRIDGDDVVQLGYVSRALMQVAAHRGRAARTYLEADASGQASEDTATVHVVIDDATSPDAATAPEMAD